jgi:2-phosphoglycerate kinase
MSKIILIGGPQRCGKSTLAQSLSTELNIPWITTSTLEAVIRIYTPKEDDQKLFPKSMLRKKGDGGNDHMYSTYSAEKIVESYFEQAETVSGAIRAFVKHIYEQDWNYILEGYHITPKLVAQIKNDGFDVDSIILVNTNPDELIHRSLSSKTKHDWVRDEIREKGNYTKIGEMITLYSNTLITEAKKYDVRVVDMGQDFQKNFNEVFESLK